MEANPKSPIVSGSLDRITDPAVRDAFRNMQRTLENVYGGISRVVNFNLARQVTAPGPQPPFVNDGESILWERTDIEPHQFFIVSRVGTNIALYPASSVLQVDEIPIPPNPEPVPEPPPDVVVDPVLPNQGQAVPTFHSMSLYWDPPSVLPIRGCAVRYKRKGVNEVWKRGFDMPYDARTITNPDRGTTPLEKCRGSVVHLQPNTEYLFNFGVYPPNQVDDPAWVAQVIKSTWSETFTESGSLITNIPASQTTMLTVTQSGTAAGYHVVKPTSGVLNSSTIDVNKNADYCIIVNASFVKIKGLNLKRGRLGGILIGLGVTDIVIEDCDIEDWGTAGVGQQGVPPSGLLGQYGINCQAGITNERHESSGASYGSALLARLPEHRRIIVQRNKIHDPTFGTNSWDEGHPTGPHAIYLRSTSGQNVIRYNEFYSTGRDDPRGHASNKWFNDCLGSNDNAGPQHGFPGPDSDIYGNIIKNWMDDGIEAEGQGRNVRVWKNYFDRGGSSFVGTNAVHAGPTYVWRNVCNRGRSRWAATEVRSRITFLKTGDRNGFGGGRKFVFNNTVLRATDFTDGPYTWGLNAGGGINDVSNNVTGIYSRNNIFQPIEEHWSAYGVTESGFSAFLNNVDRDMCSSNSWGTRPAGQPVNGLLNTDPVFKTGHGFTSEQNGKYQLADGSPGTNFGEFLNNFTDGFTGTNPDLGAHEGNHPDMKFGLAAVGTN